MTKLNGELMEWRSHEPIIIKGNSTTLPIEIPQYSQFFIEGGKSTRMGLFKRGYPFYQLIEIFF